MMGNGLKSRNSRQRFLSAALVLLFVLYPASTAVAAGQKYFKTWTTENGLPQNHISYIAQTHDGYLWLATLDGLARFDGVRFKIFKSADTPEFPTSRIVSMFVDSAGRLWLKFDENRTVVVYENGRFKAFVKGRDFESDYFGESRFFYNWEESSLRLENEPEMIFRAGDREYFYENGRFAVRSAGDLVIPAKVFTTDYTSAWIDDGDTFINVKDGKAIRYPKDSPLPFTGQTLFAVSSSERNGVLWFLAPEGNFISQSFQITSRTRLFSFSEGRLISFPLKGILFSIDFDKGANLWITDYFRGIFKIDAETIAANNPNRFDWRLFTGADGLLCPDMRVLFADREGNLWAGSTKGLHFINPEPAVKVFSKATGLPADNVYSIIEDSSGTIWFGAWNDWLITYRDGKFASELSPLVTALFVDRSSRLWKNGVFGEIFVRENERWVPVDYRKGIPKQDKEGGEISFITQDKEGAMWFGNRLGLVRYANGESRLFTTKDGLPSDIITSYLITRNGEMWIGTTGGVARFENGSFRAFTVKDGLAGNFTRSFYEDDEGTIWIGGYDNGLTRYKNESFAKITRRDGLFSGGVFCILEDDGWFWMNSNQGIFRVRRQELNDFADGKIESVTSVSYGPEDGLYNVEGNGGKQPAGLKASDGKLWFPTAGGVAVIDPKSARRNLPPPPVLIEEARIDQEQTQTNVDEIRVEPNQSALEIDYTGLGFVGAERTRFRYRLEGLDENWTDAGTRRTAYFSHLPEGEYTFRVTAANQEGVWNPEGATVKVVIVPPFYHKSWFYALTIIGVFGLITFIYLSRVRRLQALNQSRAEFSRHLIESQESERRRIALELHDSLGQTLAVIRNRTMMGLNAENFPQAIEQFREISEASTLALRETREIAHNLHPAQIENLGLTTALRTLVKSVEGGTGIKCETDIDEVPASLPYEAAIVIYRISQETLSNIIRHSDASLVRVTLRVQESRLVLTIKDDGRGFQEDRITKGLGLNGIRERALMIGGEISIASQPGEGTRTTLTLDLDGR